MNSHRTWPEPLIQPDKSKDCSFHSVAYLCRCLGYSGVTPEQVKQFRHASNIQEYCYPETIGIQAIHPWHFDHDRTYQLRFWLGINSREWVEAYLHDGDIGIVMVERIAGKGHSIVVLESLGDAGVYIMDPLTGFCTETWEWFLSIGAGLMGCHYVNGWYRSTQG